MPDYIYQYRREQRNEFTISADTEAEAEEQAEKHIQTLKLSSPDDTSDDPGEMELLEIQ